MHMRTSLIKINYVTYLCLPDGGVDTKATSNSPRPLMFSAATSILTR